MRDYYYKDILSAFNFGKKYPELKIDDWFEYNRTFLSEDEIELYKNIEYTTFMVNKGGKNYEFILLKLLYSFDLLENITNKITGLKEYYQLNPFPGEWGCPIYSIISFEKDFFNSDNWVALESFPGIEIVEDEKIMFLYETHSGKDKWDDCDFERYEYYKKDLKNNSISFWDIDSCLKAYIKPETEFIFKPISFLFKND